MKVTSFLILSLMIWACSLEKSIIRSQKKAIEGIWSEKWIGADTDVDYVDTIEIKIVKNKIYMICLSDSNCVYDSIALTKKDFLFKMENIKDPKEKFIVYYKFQLNKNLELLEGTIKNSKNQTDTVRLKKERSL